MSPRIIFEDDALLVIDKPAGVVVNRAETAAKSETIQDFAEFKILNLKFKIVTEIEKEFASRAGIVHRLDKDTSGVLVIAKTPQAFENLKNQFKNRETTKKYLALVHGEVYPAAGTIKAPIERNPFNRMHFGVFPGGRKAETKYRMLNYLKDLKNFKFTYLECEPKTGRTHQIRVHLKYLNHPLVSDPIYAGRKQSKQDLTWCPRLFLHAASLTFRHPVTDEVMSFSLPLPSDLQSALDKLVKVD
ncbi:RluA family pseudouridine synthase [Patescibacteria group bacterium]|nr:RluA family pseudouridine synthase [Patescibacteria group bacterium]